MTAVVSVSAMTFPDVRVGARRLEHDDRVLALTLVLDVGDLGDDAQLACRGQGRQQPDLLGPVQQHREVEGADLGRRGERQAGDDGVGGQHLLLDVVAVLGGERQIFGARTDAQRIEQSVALGPFEELRVCFRAYGVGIDRHSRTISAARRPRPPAVSGSFSRSSGGPRLTFV